MKLGSRDNVIRPGIEAGFQRLTDCNITCLWVEALEFPACFTSQNVYSSKHSYINVFLRHKVNCFLRNGKKKINQKKKEEGERTEAKQNK